MPAQMQGKAFCFYNRVVANVLQVFEFGSLGLFLVDKKAVVVYVERVAVIINIVLQLVINARTHGDNAVFIVFTLFNKDCFSVKINVFYT